jgi:cell pole-organizing protein PopZ
MMAFQVPKEQQTPRVWLRLTGEAKDAVEHLDMEGELATEKGLEILLAVLDTEFVEEECDRVDEAVSYFWNLRREYGQSMETYLSNMHQAKVRMKKEDPNTTIGDKAYAVRLLKKAGLNREEQQQQVLSATNAEYDAKKIETALKRLFKNIAMSDKSRTAFRPRGSGKKGSYKGGVKSSSGKGSFRPFSGAYAAEQYDMTADDQAYYQDYEEGAEDEEDDVLDLASNAQFLDDAESDGAEADDAPLLGEETQAGMRDTLAALAMLAQPGAQPQIVRSGETSIESLMRELLRPALAEWLEKNLPPLVERLVADEIRRISGKKG